MEMFSQTPVPFIKYDYGTELQKIIDIEGPPDYIDRYKIGHIYYGRNIAGYNLDIEYRIIDNKLLATHYHLKISEFTIEKYKETFFNFVVDYNNLFGESRIIEADYITYIRYTVVWKIDKEPNNFSNGFLKITMQLPKNNDIKKCIIYISHIRYII
jgi:hypothetical protein